MTTMSISLLATLLLGLALVSLMVWRLRIGWRLGLGLFAALPVLVLGGAALLSEMTDGRAAPAETVPWLLLAWVATALVSGVRHARGGVPARAPAPPPPAPERAASAPPARRPTVFLSYRRSDSQDVAGRIYDRLERHFGAAHVFKDVDSIPLGVDFRNYVGDQIARCDALLAVIGPGWLEARNEAGRRLDDPLDLVRVEVAAALARDIPVIPILVGGASMPGEEGMPGELGALAFRNGVPVRADPDFHRDVDRLIAGIEAHGEGGLRPGG